MLFCSHGEVDGRTDRIGRRVTEGVSQGYVSLSHTRPEVSELIIMPLVSDRLVARPSVRHDLPWRRCQYAFRLVSE
jgi:hypothetical protein